jgi:hypothetical protein
MTNRYQNRPGGHVLYMESGTLKRKEEDQHYVNYYDD